MTETSGGWQRRLYERIAEMARDPHTQVHRGRMFTAHTINESLSDNASMDVAITPPADDWPHLIVEPGISGTSELRFYEGATVTGGVAMPAHNHLRTSSRVFGGTIVSAPTVSDTGSPLLLGMVVPGGAGPMAVGAAQSGFDTEWALKAGTTYLIRLTNRSGQTRRASLVLTFYSAPLIQA